MRIIGLTGGVGSGKSTVGKMMQDNFSVKLSMTDSIGHLAMEPGTDCYCKIVEEFGEDLLTSEKEIDRNALAKIVFADMEKLQKLNGIIHPWVKKYLAKDCERESKEENYKYYVIESAILFQTGLDKMCEEVWYVDTDDAIRRERLKKSRGYSDEKIDSIMEQQKENLDFKLKCNEVILNNKEMSQVLEQLENILV